MPRISKNNSVYSGKKNVDITGLINNNQTGGGKNNVKNIKKTNKKHKDNYDDSEFGSDNSDFDEDEEDEEDEDEDENELDDNDNANDDDNDNDNDNDNDDNSEKDDNYSEKSEKESNAGDDEVGDDDKNYIDDEEALKTKCYSKYAKVDYDDLDLDEMFGDEPILLDKNIRVSKPVLTKYEFVRLLTDRTKQLAQGAKHMLKNTQELSSKEIAKLEIKEGVIPLIIERPIPNSKSERWKVSELQIPEHFFSM
jgi:DNA-directed RNA polymerase subunit K/omega